MIVLRLSSMQIASNSCIERYLHNVEYDKTKVALPPLCLFDQNNNKTLASNIEAYTRQIQQQNLHSNIHDNITTNIRINIEREETRAGES